MAPADAALDLLGLYELLAGHEPQYVQHGKGYPRHVEHDVVANHLRSLLGELQVLARPAHQALVEIAVILRRRAAHDDAPVPVDPLEHRVEGLATDRVEVKVDAFRALGGAEQTRGDGEAR